MEVTVYDERGALRALASEWNDLARQDPSATIFQTPEYAGVWWEEFGALRSLALSAVRNGDEHLRGVAPLSMEPDGSVHFVGDPSITDYLAPVSRPEDRDVVAAGLIDVAVSLSGFTKLTLSGLIAGSGWPEAIGAAAKSAGLDVEEQMEDVAPVLQTHGSYESYLASIPGKQRHEIRRKERRLSDAGGYDVRLSTPETLDRDLAAFFEMHRSANGPKGKFMHENMATYFTRLAHTMSALGRLRFALLDMGGVPVAGIYGFSDGGTWSIYNSAYDHSKRELSPGMVLVAETIRMAADEGCHTYDFLRGSEDYKYRFGATDRQVVRIIGRPSGDRP